jgi:hypothetical protein
MVGNRVMRLIPRLLVVTALVLVPASAAIAQNTAIIGEVTDETGGVLPGVTVEVASPALIEQIRTAFTDGEGLYRIIELRPGDYTVTFSLPGFSTVIREGVALTTGFIANIDAEMVVGGIEETILVSGATPVVDVQQVMSRRVVTKDVIAALPSARNFQTLAVTIPAVSLSGGMRQVGVDVGGSLGDQSSNMMIHGSTRGDAQNFFNGMPMNGTLGVTQHGNFVDMGSIEEVDYMLGSVSAEVTTGGVHVNLIHKDGTNQFSGTYFQAFTNQSLQTDNLTSELVAKGARRVNEIDKIWDYNITFGGPIKRDKLWYMFSARYWGLNDRPADMWYDMDPDDYTYTPDLSRPALDDSYLRSFTLRFTWNAAESHKVNFFTVFQGRCLCHTGVNATRAPEATRSARSKHNYVGQLEWLNTYSSRVLLQMASSFYRQDYHQVRQNDNTAVIERSTNLNFRGPSQGEFRMEHLVLNHRGSMSYVTGSHNLKVGVDFQHSLIGDYYRTYNNDQILRLSNGVPQSVIQYTTPFFSDQKINAGIGLYAQDAWTVNKLTATVGLRFDYQNASAPAVDLPAARFVAARSFAEVTNVPLWKDLNPRLGLAYDLFGDGRTALKATLSRYVRGEAAGFARRNSPVHTTVNNATRTWNDRNGDFVPDEGELGPLSNVHFGEVVVRNRYDQDIKEGFGVRLMNWEASAGVQHELAPGMSLTAFYHRRWWGNFQITDNLKFGAANYDPYCITAPLDSRLPDGGGQEICRLFDVNPAVYGQYDGLITLSNELGETGSYGDQTEIYDGVDASIDAVLGEGGMLTGGVSIGRVKKSKCFVVDSPEELRFCSTSPPMRPRWKFAGSYPLPWDVQIAGTFQNLPGPELLANYLVSNALIAPSLGRDLAAGSRSVKTVALIEPGTMYGERMTQVDIRMSKIIHVGRARIQANFDLYNLLNASPILATNSRFGSSWLRPTYVLPGRIFKFGGQVDF